MKDLCLSPHKLILEVLRSQYLDTLTYKDIRNISRDMHKARPSQLLALPTDIEETHKALCAVQILNNSVKRKAMEDLCGRPHKLMYKELRSQ